MMAKISDLLDLVKVIPRAVSMENLLELNVSCNAPPLPSTDIKPLKSDYIYHASSLGMPREKKCPADSINESHVTVATVDGL